MLRQRLSSVGSEGLLLQVLGCRVWVVGFKV